MPKPSRLAAITSQAQIGLTRQCELLGIPHGQLYYKPVRESAFNLKRMRLMDEHYLEHPDKGPRRMQSWLKRKHGIEVNIKRLNRLYYRVMGLQSVLPGPHTSKPTKGHTIYPYLLRGLSIKQPNQVWQTDISYIGLQGGYLYLTAWIDVATRFVMEWYLSNTMTAEWCVESFQRAIQRWGRPQIVNTDQGSQFTSIKFIMALTDARIAVSMDGKGAWRDNVFVERLWRTINTRKSSCGPTRRSPKQGRPSAGT